MYKTQIESWPCFYFRSRNACASDLILNYLYILELSSCKLRRQGTIFLSNVKDMQIWGPKETQKSKSLTCPFIRSSGCISGFIFTNLIAIGFPVRRSDDTSNSTSSKIKNVLCLLDRCSKNGILLLNSTLK